MEIKQDEKRKIEELAESEGTLRALRFALGVQNDYPYSHINFCDYDSRITRESAISCLDSLESMGLAENCGRECYHLNKNPGKKAEILEYLKSRGVIIEPLAARPIFVRNLRLVS